MINNRNDDFLYDLNRPLMMAADDDDDDDILDDDQDDAVEKDSSDADSDVDSDKASMSDEGSQTARNSSGVTSSSNSFGLITVAGIIPLALLILYMIQGAGLSTSAMLFMAFSFIGLILSVWTFVHYKKGVQTFNKFDIHSFFKWSEIAVITVVLLGISFLNLSQISSGGFFVLSAESTIQTQKPSPIFAPKPPEGSAVNEEVFYETNEISPIQSKKGTEVKNVGSKAKTVNTVQNKKVVRPVTYRKVYSKPVYRQPVNKKVIPSTPIDKVVEIPAIPHEDEEGTSTTGGRNVSDLVDDAVGITEISANSYSSGSTSSHLPSSSTGTNYNVETTGIVASLFMGGILCAPLGYGFALAIAGAILGMMRKFNNPFSAKTKEIINEETGEITLETEAQTTVNKLLDLVLRFFVGFNIGGTIGFILGAIITVPLYFMFYSTGEAEPIVSNFLMSLGVVKNPDLAYSSGLIVAGIMVPFVMLVVGKGSPAGVTVTEEKVRQIYSIPVTINKVSTDMTSIPEPAIISFDLDDEEKESKDGLLVDDFSDDHDENLTKDLLSEFGVELENFFNLPVNLPVKSNGNGDLSKYEKQKVTSILENSLGELGNVSVQVSAELGKATIMLTDWLNLSEGMLIELDKPVSEEIDILINDVPKGKGKLTVIDNNLSVKVSKSNFSQSLN